MEKTGCGTGTVAPAARNSRKLLRFLRGAAAEKLDALNKNLFFQGGELLANGWAGWLGWLAGLAGTVGGNIILSLRTLRNFPQFSSEFSKMHVYFTEF